MSVVPLCMAFACGSVETPQPVIPDDGDDPTSPEPTSACEPRQAGLSADFELTIEGWRGDTNGYFLYNVAAPCQVEAATPTSRDLRCTEGDGAEHSLTLTIADSRIAGAIPSNGPVFLRAARTDAEFGENQWFVVRAGSEVTGALLAGGLRAGHETPEAGDGYFSPIGMVLGPEEGCPVEVEDQCLNRRRARMGFWVDDIPGASILDGHEGDIDASGTYRAVVGASVDHMQGGLLSCGGDDPRYGDDLRVLIGAKAQE
ncbi:MULTISPECIES: hypothetical protein [Sorangium]|uniref:Uncharacterized protein n=1 Tax=Sorangium cellulosum TaxID=56 RepID=A0A4P2R5S8_SORCE|nr:MULTISPECIES: hypothetical protein [Sorangium]AUX38021.1 hypothetical protein SOCE836_102590 [Sorangium cellulosum]WCQ97309.1 hypothetical protein NQZ70_10100 [Sorangium sp. Soce836]